MVNELVQECLPRCFFQFVSKYVSTIGVDYGVKPVTVRGQTVKVNFWDLSGHPEFLHVRNEFYRDAQGVRPLLMLSARAQV